MVRIKKQFGQGENEAKPCHPLNNRDCSYVSIPISMARRNLKGGAMGIFDKIFGVKYDYPSLDSSSPAARQLESVRPSLEKLAQETKDPLEVVPTEDSVYIIVGKPPKNFGIAWIEDGDKIINFKSVVDEKGLSPISLDRLGEELRKAYIAHQDKPRYLTKISDRDVVVTPSMSLLNQLKDVVEQAVA
jgi:hypothetical protein